MQAQVPIREPMTPSTIQPGIFLSVFFMYMVETSAMIKATGPMFSLLQPAISESGSIQTYIPQGSSSGFKQSNGSLFT